MAEDTFNLASIAKKLQSEIMNLGTDLNEDKIKDRDENEYWSIPSRSEPNDNADENQDTDNNSQPDNESPDGNTRSCVIPFKMPSLNGIPIPESADQNETDDDSETDFDEDGDESEEKYDESENDDDEDNNEPDNDSEEEYDDESDENESEDDDNDSEEDEPDEIYQTRLIMEIDPPLDYNIGIYAIQHSPDDKGPAAQYDWQRITTQQTENSYLYAVELKNLPEHGYHLEAVEEDDVFYEPDKMLYEIVPNDPEDPDLTGPAAENIRQQLIGSQYNFKTAESISFSHITQLNEALEDMDNPLIQYTETDPDTGEKTDGVFMIREIWPLDDEFEYVDQDLDETDDEETDDDDDDDEEYDEDETDDNEDEETDDE